MLQSKLFEAIIASIRFKKESPIQMDRSMKNMSLKAFEE